MRKRLMPGLIAALAALSLAILPTLSGCNGEQPGPSTPTPAPDADQGIADGVTDAELWVMSQCPFGTNALLLLHQVKLALGDKLRVNVRYVVSETDGALKSLHGDKEVELDKAWICAEALSADKSFEMINAMIEDKSIDWRQAAQQAGIDADKLGECISGGRADELLRVDLQRSKELGVDYSPALFFEGNKYSGKISSMDLFQRVCAEFPEDSRPAVCADPPMNLSFNDGPGGNMRCGDEQGQTNPEIETDAIELLVTIVSYDAALTSPVEQVLETTRRLYPNLKIKEVRSDSAEGARLIKDYGLVFLPAFLLEKKVEQTKPFQLLVEDNVLDKKTDHYLLRPERVGANVRIDRPLIAGNVKIFYTPYSPRVPLALMDTIDLIDRLNIDISANFDFLPYAPLNQDGQPQSQFSIAELEEVRRQNVIWKNYRGRFLAYLKDRCHNLVRTYWEEYVSGAGLDPAEIKRLAEGQLGNSELERISKEAAELGVRGDFAILVNNREFIQVKDKEDFARIFRELGLAKEPK